MIRAVVDTKNLLFDTAALLLAENSAAKTRQKVTALQAGMKRETNFLSAAKADMVPAEKRILGSSCRNLCSRSIKINFTKENETPKACDVVEFRRCLEECCTFLRVGGFGVRQNNSVVAIQFPDVSDPKYSR